MRERIGAARDYECFGSWCANQARQWVSDAQGWHYPVCARHARVPVVVGPSYQ